MCFVSQKENNVYFVCTSTQKIFSKISHKSSKTTYRDFRIRWRRKGRSIKVLSPRLAARGRLYIQLYCVIDPVRLCMEYFVTLLSDSVLGLSLRFTASTPHSSISRNHKQTFAFRTRVPRGNPLLKTFLYNGRTVY